MHFNGIIVLDLDYKNSLEVDPDYKGVMRHGDVYSTEFAKKQIYNEMFDKYNDWVIYDEDFAKRYVNACIEAGFRIEVMGIALENEYPLWNGQLPKMTFLGYECVDGLFSYTSYDLYSGCNLSDCPEYEAYREKLNANKLFDDMKTLKACIDLRNEVYTDGRLEHYSENAECIGVYKVDSFAGCRWLYSPLDIT